MNKVFIEDFSNSSIFLNVFPKDENDREINIYKFENYSLIGDDLFYPNPILLSNDSKHAVNPIKESVMSLKKINKNKKFINLIETKLEYTTEESPVFFFIYNTDNYFHFVYDTLPYLISYLKIKKEYPDIKLLMNFPNAQKIEFYQFVCEFLEMLNITKENIQMADKKTLYKCIYISNSYTHDLNSDLPPRNEIYDFYKNILKINNNPNSPKKIYVSRRSWIHNNYSNIGTNYTTRRKLINEDILVQFLIQNGFTEVFPEILNIKEKIELFYNADIVIGPIGGGLCNVLFSKSSCKVLAIVSPHFLDVNKRFLYSLNKTNLTLFDDAHNTEKTNLKKFMRVKVGEVIGEINEVNGDDITVAYTEKKVAGWNNESKYAKMIVKESKCIKLDEGLNCCWKINFNNFKKYYDTLCNL